MGIEEIVQQAEGIKKSQGVDAAIEFYTGKLSGMVESDNDVARMLNARGFLRRIKKEYEIALIDYEEALGHSRNNDLSSEILINKADSLRFLGRYAEAHSSIDNVFSKIRNNYLIAAKARRQKGLIFVKEGKFNDALTQYIDAISCIESQIYFKEHNNPTSQTLRVKAEVLEPLGSLYVGPLKDVSKAEEAYALFKESLDISLKLDNEQNIVNAVRGLGKVAMMTGKPEEAIPHYETAWNILQKTQYGRSITTTALLLTEAHLANNDPEKARPYLAKFIDDMQNLKKPDADNDHRRPHFENVLKMIHQSKCYGESPLDMLFMPILQKNFTLESF